MFATQSTAVEPLLSVMKTARSWSSILRLLSLKLQKVRLPKRGAPRFVAAPRRLVNNLLAGACQLSAKLQPCCRHTLPFRDTMPKALAARRLQFTFPHFSSFFLRKCPHGCFSLNLPFKQLQFLIDIAFPLR